MNRIQVSESFGVITARRPSPEPSVPGALIASAMHSRTDGWFVSKDQARHLVYVGSEAEARQWLETIAAVLS